MDIWKPVVSKGIEWLVSVDGRIKTPSHEHIYIRTRNGKEQVVKCAFKGGEISPCKTKNGYLEVSAKKNGKRIKHLVHRLVGMAWISGYSEELTINHIDGNKLNNSHDNLEWVSLARNTQHQWETGLVNLRGENNPTHKLTTKQVVYIRRLLKQGVTGHTLAIVAGVSPSYIALIRDRKRWHGVVDNEPCE